MTFPVTVAGVAGRVEVENTTTLPGEIHRRFVLVNRRVVGQVIYVARPHLVRATEYGWKPADERRAPLSNLATACRRLIHTTGAAMTSTPIPGVTLRAIKPCRGEGLRIRVLTSRGVAGHVVYVPRRRLWGRQQWGWRPACEHRAPLTSREAAIWRLPNMKGHVA